MTPKEKDRSVIYHYTTIEGLLGVIQESKLFATDMRYLNDANEVSYPVGLFEEVLDRAGSRYHEGESAYKLEKLSIATEGVQELHLEELPRFVTCFCSDGDLLSQWRSYAANMGFAIGFDRSRLAAIASELQLSELKSVVYTREKQIETMEKRIVQYLDSEIETDMPVGELPIESIDVAAELWWTVSWFKSDAFREEHEWRVVTSSDDPSDFRFRQSSVGVTPYIEFEFPTAEQSPIVSIKIGPTAHPVEAEHAIKALAATRGLSVDVSRTRIPLR